MTTDSDSKPGRPRRGTKPPIPWDEIEKEYICGEIMRQLEDGSFERHYPSIRDLAEKFSVQRTLVGYHSRRHNWPARREEFRNELRTEIQQMRAKARALTIEEAMGILDAYLEKFRAAVESGHVRVDSITDFNTAMRLRQFLGGEADSRQEIQGGLTLEAIQARHAKVRQQLDEMTPALSGVAVEDQEDHRGRKP
jgi:hypothetical protein